MPTVTVTLQKFRELASGEKNGRKWALYGLEASDGRMYTTFDAKWTEKMGQSVTVEYEIVQKGERTQYRLVELKKDGSERVLRELEALNSKVDVIYQLLQERLPGGGTA